ncbi:uncharacterized protein LOC129580260 [Sitodiplosis mosellana]|uniref:uncharacterized protein LOC129580260 n=1 Tax=Sitodiplosis mosellana TaxID=263140 RepID=UPI0024447751|nr:uncharacterized protein LOC129580260 [Sitodiplosis mosellana]
MIDTSGDVNIAPNRKDNEFSTALHQRGNEFFRAENWSEAMTWYNRSLSYAEIGSENVALAYSSRSACFFNMELYEKALIDIETAKSANVPEHLLVQLEQRQQECHELMQTAQKPKVTRDFKLSYEANKNFPCMVDVVEIKYNQEFGRHLVAKCDIPVDKIVLMEKEFIAAIDNDRMLCCNCSRMNSNFIACPQCPAVVFCDLDCMNQNLWHKWECGSSVSQLNFNMKLHVRAVLMAIESFRSVEDLMEFVGSALLEDPGTIPTSMHDLKSKYHFFFNLKRSPQKVDDIIAAYTHFKCIQMCPKINALFDGEEKTRFLMHLVFHHTLIIQTNSIGGDDFKSIHNVFSMVNHSCAPNLHNYIVGNHGIFKTIRYVKMGEQLCFNYLGSFNEKTHERQKELESNWKFICKCAVCEPTNNIVNARLASDPRFQFVHDNVHDESLALDLLDKCRQFLNEHGQLAWSAEVGFISQVFAGLITALED